ncbi:MAG: alpha/beta hydrolase [Fibrobacterota bacterium]|nr:alpha/beta hydrolase [Fibrobacterota bacterium]QQS07757.1 MAG: alpha/beta hydrolase [Fibrobacterota bacterium]
MVIETDPGLAGKTIYRPSDLGPGKKYPILVWGNGACARNSTETADYYAEIASHGYIVINEGTPGGKESYDMGAGLGTLGGYLIKGFDWALQQNGKPCSRFYQSLDTMVGSFGWSCGGLMAYGASLDPRVDATIIMSSGLLSPDQATLNKLHAPIAYAIGGPDDMAYPNGLRDFNGIAHLPTVFANVPSAGHGGTYWADNGGEFAKFAVAWFNWFLKADTGATGRQKFIGNTCGFCSGQWSSMQTKKLP